MKRILCFFAAVLVIAASFVSCAKDQGDPAGTTAAPAATDGTSTEAPATEPVDENGYRLDNLGTLDMGGRTFRILYWSDAEHVEFDVKDPNGDLVDEAIVARDARTMERLKCNIEYIGIPGNVSNIAAFVKAVETDMKSGNPQYDLVGSYSSTAGTLAYNGYSADLLTLEHIDLDMPWWPSELIGTSTLNNHLYFATGDISTNLLYMMYATFYNKAYLNEFGLTDPNTLVSSGKWTLEEFEKMTKGIYSDVDGDGKKSDGDRYGYATYWLHLDCLFGSVGIKSVEKNSDDLLTVSDSYYSEKTQRMLEYLVNNFTTNDDWYYAGQNGAAGKMQQKIFSEGRSLFMTERVRVCKNVLANTNIDYGILPVPKYDESQENYITTMAMPFSMYSIPVSASDPDASAALLECLGSEGYRRVTPKLFEVAMKVRYSKDHVSSRMYDIIRESVTFDLGRIFNESLGKIPNATLRNLVNSNSSDWASRYQTIRPQFEKYISDINAVLKK